MNLSTPESIKQELHKSLSKLEKFEECALVNYPDRPNIGDHIIWLGGIFYLTDVAKTKINHVAVHDLPRTVINQKLDKKAPLIFTGGGSINDIYRHIKHYEEIISEFG